MIGIVCEVPGASDQLVLYERKQELSLYNSRHCLEHSALLSTLMPFLYLSNSFGSVLLNESFKGEKESSTDGGQQGCGWQTDSRVG